MTKELSRKEKITDKQLRMACAALSWNINDLCRESGLKTHTIWRARNGDISNKSSKLFRFCFEGYGIKFLEKGVLYEQ